MSESGSKKILAAAVVWLLIAGAAAAVYKYFSTRNARRANAASVAKQQYQHEQLSQQYGQLSQEAAQYGITPSPLPADADNETISRMLADLQARIKQAQLLRDTGSQPQLTHQIKLALDSFSGYCVLRSEEFRTELANQRIQLELVDDKADYAKRIKDLQSRQVQIAAFTIDALIKHSDALGSLPATIILVIDETRGADAMVAYKQAVPNIDALNRDDARLVLTRDSPSETLARVVQADFNLPKLKADRWVEAKDAADVYQRFRTAIPSQPQAFVLWEPYVSKVLENPDAHVVVDSSKFKGIIVDVLVAERGYLRDNPVQVAAAVKAYLTASFAHQRKKAGTVSLVKADAASLGEPLTEAQAERLVQGIWWKNTLENYAHFGNLSATESQGLQHIEDMIRKITAVLMKTGAITRDPTDGSPNKLYFNNIFAQLQRENFHPGVAGTGEGESIRAESELPSLSEDEWKQLLPVGTLQVEPISFGRGNAELLDPGRAALENLVSTLKTWPQYYLLIHGRARPEGDPDENRRLATDRARAVERYLAQQGVSAARIHSEAVIEASGTGGLGQSVAFRLLQKPY